jgi:outer membrane protein assembly factor BamB
MTKRTVFMLLLSIGLILGLSSVACASDWPTFQKNNYNNAIVDGTAPNTIAIAEVWGDTIGGAGWLGWDGAPIIANGTVYAIFFNGHVYAYNLTGAIDPGEPLWTNIEVGGDGSFELSTAAYDTENDRLFVALSNGNAATSTGVHAINGVTGETIWSNTNQAFFPVSYQFNNGVKYDNGKVYVASCHVSSMYDTDAGHLTCLDAGTGVVEWDYHCTSGGFYWATPAIIGDYVVIGCDDGIVRSFEKDGDGTVIDYVDAGRDQIRGGITYDENNGCIYFTTVDGYVIKCDFNTYSGAISNKVEVSTGTRMTTTPTVAGDYVYVTDDSAVISCINKAYWYVTDSHDLTGTWGGIKGSPVVYDAGTIDYIYVTVNGPTAPATCVSFTNGYFQSVTGTFGSAEYTLQGVAIVDGYIVYGNDNQDICCYK